MQKTIERLKAVASVIKENTEPDGYCYMNCSQITEEAVFLKGVMAYAGTLRILLEIGAVVKDVKINNVLINGNIREKEKTVYRVIVDIDKIGELFINRYVNNKGKPKEENFDIRLYKFEDTVFI